MTTAQAANGILTTMDIKGVMGVSGNRGPQWQLQCRWPWSNPNQVQYVDTLWLEQSDYPEQPSAGLYEVEVAMVGRRIKKDQEMYDGSRYWMHKYKILRLLGPTNQMHTQPDFSASVDGYVSTAPPSNGYSGGGTPGQPTANAKPTNGSEILGAVRGHCENAVLFLAQVQELPGLFDEDGTPNWDMMVFYRDEYWNKVCSKDITVYAQDNEEPVAEAEAEEPAPPPPPAAPPEHFCEKHQESYTRYTDGRYGHKWDEDKHWCLEGNDFLLDNNGNPVTEALI